MKFVMVKWIFDWFSGPVALGDGNLLQRDHLVRKDGVYSPIPERLAKINSGFLPVLLVDSVCCSNLLGMLMQSLLRNDCHRSLGYRWKKGVEQTSKSTM